MSVDYDVKDYARLKNIEKGLLKTLRLDDDKWFIESLKVSTGVVPYFSDDPEVPTIITNSSEISTLSLGDINIGVSFKHGVDHICPHCGKRMSVNKWVRNEFSNPPMFGMSSSVTVSVPQLHCKDCGGYPQISCPLVVRNHTYTKLSKFDTLESLSKQNATDTMRSVRLGKRIVSDILGEAVTDGRSTQDLSNVDTLYLDEIQSTSGQNYTSMFADQDHRFICGVEGHDIQSVCDAVEEMKKHGLDPMKIRFVSVDMSVAYKVACKKLFPKAILILDRFHVLKLCSGTSDKTRKRVIRELKAKGLVYPTNVRYTVLYRRKNLNDIHSKRLEEIRVFAPELALAVDLKEEFYEIFDNCKDRHEARSAFFSWYNRVKASKIPEFMDFAHRIMVRLNEILRCFDYRITNAVSEGMNNKYKKIKSAAYGFRKPQSLIDMCMYRMGRIDIRI